MDCSRFFPACAMDFDHRDPTTKSYGIAELRRQACSWAKMEAEIAKCDLVCACCHRIRTWKKERHPVFNRCKEQIPS